MEVKLKISKDIFNQVYFPYLFNYDKRYEVYYGGSGSGKSVFITQKLLLKLLNEQRKLLVIRKVGNTLKDSVFQLFLDMLIKFQIYSYCKINKSDFSITLPNNSIILFKGLDDSEKIKSIAGIDDIWIEEASEIDLDDFTQLDLRLRSKAPHQQILLSFNPISKANWTYKKWFKDGYDSSNTMVLKTTYKDNHFLGQTYINTLENLIKNNPTYYKVYALGEFCSLDKLIYNNWEKQDLDVSELKQNKDLKLLVGLDFGFTNDPTALITSLIDEKNKIIYIIDEFCEKGLTNDKIAEIIKYKGLSKSIIIADAAEVKSIEEIKRHGISRIRQSIKGQGSIMQGIQKLQQFKIIVNSICFNTITEFENYSFKKDKKTGEYINEPIDSFNHCLDALRYSLQCTESNKLKVLDKSVLGL